MTDSAIANTNELAATFEIMFETFSRLQAQAGDAMRALELARTTEEREDADAEEAWAEGTGYRRLYQAVDAFHQATHDCWWDHDPALLL